jgi:hypothetical protein
MNKLFWDRFLTIEQNNQFTQTDPQQNTCTDAVEQTQIRPGTDRLETKKISPDRLRLCLKDLLDFYSRLNEILDTLHNLRDRLI